MIGTIEQAIVDHIEQATLGYTLRKIASYGGELTDLVNNLDRIARDFPCVLVVFGGMRTRRVIGGRADVDAKFSVMVCARSLRNEGASRTGSMATPGSYQISEDVIKLLSGKTLNQPITPFSFGSMEPLLNDRTDKALASIYGLEFLTGFTVPEDVDVSGIDDFVRFHANWDVPAHGNVGPAIPDDTHADATDHITLETNHA